MRETVVDEPIVEGVPASKAPPPPYDPLAPQPSRAGVPAWGELGLDVAYASI